MRQSFQQKIVTSWLWLQTALALVLFGFKNFSTPSTISLFQFEALGLPIALAFRLDSLSTLLFLMVSVLSLVISNYAVRYLDGEKNQAYFYNNLLFTIIAVSSLVLSSNLVMFLLSWTLTSIGLHRLLLFYSERPQAILAARKKMLLSRLGDISILIAVVLSYQVFGSFDFDVIFQKSMDEAFALQNIFYLNTLGLLFVLGALCKSAQFPFHFWLPETMETPTPVSALMHAGIINAGGFLIIRLSPILTHSQWPHYLLTIVGAFTAVYASLIMITQNDIKKKLAYSTISQMGMMMFACGLGAYSIALFHIIAHSFYKAYAFLNTGDIVIESKKITLDLKKHASLSTALSISLAIGVIFFGFTWFEGLYANYSIYFAVLILGWMQTLSSTQNLEYSHLRFGGIISSILVLGLLGYALIEWYVHSQLSQIVSIPNPISNLSSLDIFVNLAAFSIFILGFIATNQLYNPKSNFAKRLYIYLWNGGYLSSMSTRVLKKFWALPS